MKTRLLKKLRREANERYRFTIIIEPEHGAWTEVHSFGVAVYCTYNGIKGANRFIRRVTNRYIQNRIEEIRLK